ncbi:MAG: SdpI family protein [Candidatus Hydrogenedentes bacterium]|nr:SdpI family protein [Candidatus Hydrogenedentota bacterium]
MIDKRVVNIRPSLCVLGIGLAVMLALSAFAWTAIPSDAKVPIHWNIRGEADGFGTKAAALLLLPAITAGTVILVLALVRLDPRKRNVAQSQKFLTISMSALVVMLAAVHTATTANALGWKVPMTEVVLTLTGGLFMVLGNYMGKVRSNYFMGVRTPWTLSSELSWNKTNRLCGRLFFAAGLLSLALAWISAVAALIALLAITLAGTIVAVVYSSLVWKQDPQRSATP